MKLLVNTHGLGDIELETIEEAIAFIRGFNLALATIEFPPAGLPFTEEERQRLRQFLKPYYLKTGCLHQAGILWDDSDMPWKKGKK